MTDRRHLGELVSVLRLSDNANEDHWAQTAWHADVAVVKAAVAAGYQESDLSLSWVDHWTRVATAPDGRGFAAIIRGSRGAPSFGIAEPPHQDDLDAWAGAPPAVHEPVEPWPRWDLLWERLAEHEGETFHLMRGAPFRYELTRSDPVNHLRVDPTRRFIHRAVICQAVEEWPVRSPAGFRPRIHEPRYVYGIVSDDRIRRGDW